jgi:hypothetical protein
VQESIKKAFKRNAKIAPDPSIPVKRPHPLWKAIVVPSGDRVGGLICLVATSVAEVASYAPAVETVLRNEQSQWGQLTAKIEVPTGREKP